MSEWVNEWMNEWMNEWRSFRRPSPCLKRAPTAWNQRLKSLQFYSYEYNFLSAAPKGELRDTLRQQVGNQYMSVFRQSGCIWTKWLYLNKVVVSDKVVAYLDNTVVSGKYGCILTKWLCFDNVVVIGQSFHIWTKWSWIFW